MSLLIKKTLRDFKRLWSQFFSIFLMAFLATFIFSGITSVWTGMKKEADTYYTSSNLADGWIYSTGLTQNQIDEIKNFSDIKEAQASMKLAVDSTVGEKDTHLELRTLKDNTISQLQIKDGDGFSDKTDAVWLDADYASENNLKSGDNVKISLNGINKELKIAGLVISPEFIYYTGASSRIVAQHGEYGYCFISEDTAKNMLPAMVYNMMEIKVNDNTNVSQLEEKLKDIIGEHYEGYVSRSDYNGVSAFDNKVSQIRKLSMIFPSIFILLAILTMLTAMTRLINNQRLQIGTLKALGYYKSQILMHYTSYGFIFVTLGAVIGLVLGPILLSPVLVNSLQKLFVMPTWKHSISYISIILAVSVSVICTFATIISCNKLLGETPSETLRPKAPKEGARIFFEKTPLWNHMSFDVKWIVRDTNRAPVRTIMGITGFMGSMVLLIAGLGLFDSINNANAFVYEDQFLYENKITLQTGTKDENISELENMLGGDTQTADETSVAIKKDDSSYRIVSCNIYENGDLVQLYNKDNKKLTLPGEGVVVAERTAKSLGLKIGDELLMRLIRDRDYTKVKIVDIVDTPNPQGVYFSRNSWEKLGEKFNPTAILASNNCNMDENKVSDLKYTDKILNKSTQYDDAKSFIDNFLIVVMMLLAAAVLLCVVILYNLGLLNYSERIREYATLKVLGLYQKEIVAIIFKESMLLSVVGWILGLPAGLFFLSKYTQGVSTDALAITGYISIRELVIASIITFGCSIVVNLILGRRVKALNMVESLKSVD